jgi:hypothetical protein
MYVCQALLLRVGCVAYTLGTHGMRLRIEVREDTLAAGDAFCIVQCTVGLRADLRAKTATILPYAKKKIQV